MYAPKMAASNSYPYIFMLFFAFNALILPRYVRVYSGICRNCTGKRSGPTYLIIRRNICRQSVSSRPISVWQKHGEICLYLPFSHQDITIAMDVERQPGPYTQPDKSDSTSDLCTRTTQFHPLSRFWYVFKFSRQNRPQLHKTTTFVPSNTCSCIKKSPSNLERPGNSQDSSCPFWKIGEIEIKLNTNDLWKKRISE